MNAEEQVKERELRHTAQRLVLSTVNEWRDSMGGEWSRNLTHNELDQAFAIAARTGLVSMDILRKAGYED